MLEACLGACIVACRATGRHIVALEENKDIFDAILKPMKKSTAIAMVTLAPAPVVALSQDPDELPVLPRKFAHKGKFSN